MESGGEMTQKFETRISPEKKKNGSTWIRMIEWNKNQNRSGWKNKKHEDNDQGRTIDHRIRQYVSG